MVPDHAWWSWICLSVPNTRITFVPPDSFRRGFQKYIKITNPLFDALKPSWIVSPCFQSTVQGGLEYASRSQTRRTTFVPPDSFRRGFWKYIKITNPLFDTLKPSWIVSPRFHTTVHLRPGLRFWWKVMLGLIPKFVQNRPTILHIYSKAILQAKLWQRLPIILSAVSCIFRWNDASPYYWEDVGCVNPTTELRQSAFKHLI